MSDSRPSLAIICNSVPPYRVHVHQRIVRELPWLKLWTVCTHEGQDARWQHRPPSEINPIDFGSPGDGSRHGINLASFRKGGQIIEWLKKERITAVLVLGYNDLCRLRIIRWCSRNQVPCFVWGDSNIHGDFATGPKLVLKKLLVGWVVRHVKAVLPCGSLGAAFFKRYGAKPSQIFYFPNEPDYQQIWSLSEEEIVAALTRFELKRDRRRIVFSGRMVPAKRPEQVLESFTQLASDRPEWDLLMIGDGPMRASLEVAVGSASRSRITWTGFLDDQRLIAALYRGSDVLVLPSEYEPWALVVNEAVAAGMAVVCTNVVGAAAELVQNNVNGVIYSESKRHQLSDIVKNATSSDKIDQLKSGSETVLAAWRRSADPVQGLADALNASNVRS